LLSWHNRIVVVILHQHHSLPSSALSSLMATQSPSAPPTLPIKEEEEPYWYAPAWVNRDEYPGAVKVRVEDPILEETMGSRDHRVEVANLQWIVWRWRLESTVPVLKKALRSNLMPPTQYVHDIMARYALPLVRFSHSEPRRTMLG
jgi:hypothetical protein